MAKVTKEFEWRMQGMLFAYDIAKKEGLEALHKDIKTRGFFKTHLSISKKELDDFIGKISHNMYTIALTSICIALHDEFGFGKERLHRFKEKFRKVIDDTMDFDRVGQQYVSLEDYANQLNEDYDIGIDVETVSYCQNGSSTIQENKNKVNLLDIIDLLNEKGFKDAADCLEWYTQK